MGWAIALGGVAGAAALGLGLGGALQPALADRAGPVDPVEAAPPTGPVDVTPAYVSPRSLAADRALGAPPPAQRDPIEVSVRRDLASADAELRASEAELARYRDAAAAAADVRSSADPPASSAPDAPARPEAPSAPSTPDRPAPPAVGV